MKKINKKYMEILIILIIALNKKILILYKFIKYNL